MERRRRDSGFLKTHRDSGASAHSSSSGGRVSRRGPSRRDKMVQQLLRANHNAYPVRMSVQVELEVPMATFTEEELEQLLKSSSSPDTGLRLPKSRMSTISSMGRFSELPHAGAGDAVDASGGSMKPSKVTAHSSYVHYEFQAPQDDRPTKADIVVHHNGARAFVDGEARSAIFTKLPGGEVLRAAWTHHYDTAITPDLIKTLYEDGLSFKVWDTRDKVASRARFDRPKGGQAQLKAALQHIQQNQAQRLANSFDDEGQSKLHVSSALGLLDLKDPPTNAADSIGTGAKLWVDLSTLFAGDLSVESELTDINRTGLSKLQSFRVRVSVDQPILNPEQQVLMNPLIVTVQSAGDLPNTPVSFDELDERCKPTSIEFGFFGQTRRERWSCNGPHRTTATWNRRYVILTGLLDRSDFANWLLNGGGFKLRIHDRDRTSDDTRKHQELSEDVDFSDFNVVGRKLVAAGSEDSLWDPYGEATADLSPLVKGVGRLSLTVPILPCEERERAMFSKSGLEQGSAMHPGHYVASGAYLELTVQMVHPRRFDVDIDPDFMLVRTGVMTEKEIRKRRAKRPNSNTLASQAAAQKQMAGAARAQAVDGFGVEHGNLGQLHDEAKPQSKRPFTVLLIKMTPRYAKWAGALRSKVYGINSTSLSLDNLDLSERVAALQAYRLTPKQARDPTLDLISGFELELPTSRLILLEGLGNGMLHDLVTEVGWPDGAEIDEFRVMYNSSLGLSERNYGLLGVHVPRIVMKRTIADVLQKQELYFQGHPLNKCLSGLCCLEQLLALHRLADAMRFSYFPTVDSLQAIQQELAEPEEPVSAALTERLLLSRAGLTYGQPPRRYRRMTKPALDMSSPTCMHIDKDAKVDIIQRNIDQVHARSEQNSVHSPRPAMFRLSDIDASLVTSPYSAANRNSAAIATRLMQNQLAHEHGPNTLFTYNEKFQHSGSFSLVDIEQLTKDEANEKQSHDLTSEGFDATKRRVVRLADSKPQRPSSFDDSLANRARLTFDRNILPWEERRKDMRYCKADPYFGAPIDGTVHDTREAEERRMKQHDAQEWQKRVIVDDPDFKVVASVSQVSQLDKYQGLLKDKPQQKWLQRSQTLIARPLSMELDEPHEDASKEAYTLVDTTRPMSRGLVSLRSKR